MTTRSLGALKCIKYLVNTSIKSEWATE